MEKAMDTTEASATIKSWVKLYADELFTWAYYKTSQKLTAEDLVQETFLVAVHSFQKFEAKSSPKTWLFSILKNKIADYFRKQYKQNEIINSSANLYFDNTDSWQSDERPKYWQIETGGHLLDDPDFEKTLSECLNKLPGNWKASIILKYLSEKNSHAICQELDISPTNYWQIIHRAKLQLRKCLELNWFSK